MSQKQLQLESRISPEIFRRFAVFDTLYRQRRWRGPMLFAAIMVCFAAVCLSQVGKVEQAWLVGSILLLVGLGLPCVYFISFFLSVRKRAAQIGKNTLPAYTIRLKEEGIEVFTKKEQVEFSWDKLFFAYRLRDCICLYADPRRAYLLPLVSDSPDNQRFWDFICGHMPKEKTADRT